jgi:lysozyme
MKCNSAGKAIMKSSEGWRSEAYYATPEEKLRGLLSIGFGFTYYADGSKIKLGDKMERSVGDKLFDERIVPEFERKVKSMVTSEINENRFSALVSFCYNVGGTAFKKSTLLRLVNAGDFEAAADEFPKWDSQFSVVDGVRIKRPLPGLVKRRAKERELFLS